jgi:hypothetical protein
MQFEETANLGAAGLGTYSLTLQAVLTELATGAILVEAVSDGVVALTNSGRRTRRKTVFPWSNSDKWRRPDFRAHFLALRVPLAYVFYGVLRGVVALRSIALTPCSR